MEKYKVIDKIQCVKQSTMDLILEALESKGYSVVVSGVPGIKIEIEILENINKIEL